MASFASLLVRSRTALLKRISLRHSRFSTLAKEYPMKKMVIALACLFFIVTAVAAQSESQAINVESLRGLKGLAFSVVINRGGPLDETQRFEILNFLQEDAKVRFQKARIPILKFAQEIEREPGSPRFLMIIKLDQPNGPSYPVVTESKLVQNVRLSRDPSNEIGVTTWVAHSFGGGYEVTDREELREQVGGEVDRFIRAYVEVNPN